jgi:hypothetical protein
MMKDAPVEQSTQWPSKTNRGLSRVIDREPVTEFGVPSDHPRLHRLQSSKCRGGQSQS